MQNKCSQGDFVSFHADAEKANGKKQNDLASIVHNWTNALETHMMKM